jgi:hypothetical protein
MLYVKGAVTEGSDALDKVDGGSLTSKDRAIVMTPDKVYFYRLDVDNNQEEDSPNVIKPDTGGTGKRWLLVSDMSQKIYDNVLVGNALSYDPPDPPPGGGGYVIWQSDGTESGDDGDIMIKITNTDGVTKMYTLVDFSEI